MDPIVVGQVSGSSVDLGGGPKQTVAVDGFVAARSRTDLSPLASRLVGGASNESLKAISVAGATGWAVGTSNSGFVTVGSRTVTNSSGSAMGLIIQLNAAR